MKETLIVSYSYSGHTHRIAQALCALTGGDWREIYPWQPYPMAFPELLDQVQKEVQTGYRPRLLPGAGNPKPYAVAFVGSPNWCGSIAPPLASWLAKNDLSGKIILPFYSHCGGVPCDFGREVTRLHCRWLTVTGNRYEADKHRGLARLYLEDQRFTDYYDRAVPGCARFLWAAVDRWAGEA